MTKDDASFLEMGLNKLKVSFTINDIKKLKIFINELLLFNTRFDLVNAKTTDEIIIRHILDSLA